MKLNLKTTTVALAVAFAFAAPAAFAGGGWDGGNGGNGGWDNGGNNGISDPINENVNVNVNKNVTNTKNYTIEGKVKVDGTVYVNADAEALTKADQQSLSNTVTNDGQTNNASISGGALANARGNIGANVAAGDDNVQGNSTAIASRDMNTVFGHLDGETYTDQLVSGNKTSGNAAHNTAAIDGGAAAFAAGNIGLNVTAGTSNVQSNSTAMAVGDSNLAEASAVSYQSVVNNDPDNSTQRYCDPSATVGGGALAHAQGNIGVNVSAGNFNAQSNALAMTASR